MAESSCDLFTTSHWSAPPEGDLQIPRFAIYRQEESPTFIPLRTFSERVITTVEGTYDEDYDIIGLDIIITRYIEYHSSQLISDIKKKLEKTVVDSKLERKLKDNITFHENTIKRYTEESKSLINNYREISIKISPSYFGDHRKKESGVVRARKLDIIANYLMIAGKYMSINIIRKVVLEDRCLNCQCRLGKNKGISDYCVNCRSEQEDQSVVSIRGKYKESGYQSTTERRLNFIKFLDRRQGKISSTTPLIVIDQLDGYFRSLRHKSRDEINKLPFDMYGGKEGTSKPEMYIAFQRLGLTGYNEDIESICHDFWGWKFPDYNGIYDAIMSDYDDIQTATLKIKETEGDERKIGVSNQFLLLWILRHRGISCRREDFKIAETPDIVERYELLRKDVGNLLGWDQVSLD